MGKQQIEQKQVTQDLNIVLDRWAGVFNPNPHPRSPHTHTITIEAFYTFQLDHHGWIDKTSYRVVCPHLKRSKMYNDEL
ncbi:MAG: hypothetical protein VX313_02780 [Bacteroidota bacterium]|nr:hypothetical protein [Bacteroidota bacterium]